MRRGYGDDTWVAPYPDNDEWPPTPFLTASLVPTEQGSDLVMQIEDGADHRIVWTQAFEISSVDYAAAQREAAQELLKYFDIVEDVGRAK